VEELGIMVAREVGQYLVVDSRVCHGKLTFKGTRVPVSTVLVYLAKGRNVEEIVRDWPQLKREAVVEAIHLAAEALVERYTQTTGKVDEPAHSG
jgi:uncharacterized protein (DUF433 family)